MSGVFSRLEQRMSATPLSAFLLSFVCIVTIRNVLEIYADNSTMDSRQFVDFSLFYVALGLSLFLLLRKLAAAPAPLTMRAVLLGFSIVVAPPVIDMLATGGRGFNIGYVNPDSWRDALWKLVTFWEGASFDRATLGIKVEVATVTVVSALWTRHRTGRWGRAALTAAVVYLVIFAYSILPWMAVRLWDVFGAAPYRLLIHQRTLLFAALCLAQFIPALLLLDPLRCRALLRNMRLARMLHFLTMPVAGILIAGGASFHHWRGVDWLWFNLAMLAAMLYLTVQNDIADREIDRVANPKRPLAAHDVSLETYRAVGRALFATAFLLAMMAGFRLFLYVAAFTAVYTLYSTHPLRLKEWPLLSKLLIGGNTLLMVLAGYDFAGGDLRRFPGRYVFLFGFVYGVLINFIDLKDAEGDKAAGVQTLPVILGLRTAQWVVAALFAVFYPLAALLLGDLRMLWACVPAGALSAVIVLSPRYGVRHDRAIVVISLCVVLVAFALGLPQPV